MVGPDQVPWSMAFSAPDVKTAIERPGQNVPDSASITQVINRNEDYLVDMIKATACVDSQNVNFLNRYAVPGRSVNWDFIPPRVEIGAAECVDVSRVTDWKEIKPGEILFQVYYKGFHTGKPATRAFAILQQQDGRWLTVFSPYR